MSNYLNLSKFTLIVVTKCNLRCKRCCEYVPQNKPFPDITLGECNSILSALFDTVDHVTTLHLSGGGEPFLHKHLHELVEACMMYSDKFDHFMLFTNCTIIPSYQLSETLKKYRESIIVQVSRYGLDPMREVEVLEALGQTGVSLKIEKYYGDGQSFGGWVDFGAWAKHEASPETLAYRFANCAVTRDMRGNWRTRDGKVHWCSRSQRGMELGFIPACPDDFVDLFDGTDREVKRAKINSILSKQSLLACNYCSGDQGTTDVSKRYQAAEQL